MSFLTILLLAPFALIASLIFSYLYFDKSRLQNKIKNRILNRLVFIITYILIIIICTYFLSMFGLMLLFGIIGLPVLIIIDIIGIILLIKRLIFSKKNNNKDNLENT